MKNQSSTKTRRNQPKLDSTSTWSELTKKEVVITLAVLLQVNQSFFLKTIRQFPLVRAVAATRGNYEKVRSVHAYN